MNISKKILALICLLFIPIALAATQGQPKITQNEDHVISFGNNLAVIGASSRIFQSILNYPVADTMGCLISFVPAGKNLNNPLCIGSPYLKLRDKQEFVAYSSVKKIESLTPESSLRMEATGNYKGYRGEKASITTTYSFIPQSGKIDISSTIKNTGKKAIDKFSYSVYCGASTSYSFSPFHKEIFPGLNFRIYQKEDQALGWINLNSTSDKDKDSLAPEESYNVRYSILVDSQAASLMERIYQILGVKTVQAGILLEEYKGNLAEVILSDASSGSIFFRTFLTSKKITGIPLPEGTYSARANLFPTVKRKIFTAGSGKENICTIKDTAKGKIKVRILTGQGEFVPGKVTFIGLSPTESPYFKPDNPLITGKYWETFKNSRFSGEQGLEITLPVGTYLIYASRGPEYSFDQQVVEILKNDQQKFDFHINKEVDTADLISIDPHMHTTKSDGKMSIAARVKSLAAEGIEVAILTDHNYITNYLPALKSTGLENILSFIFGNEVTINGMIHYNTYPLTYREDKKNQGAINPVSDTVTPLFKLSRDTDPETLIQVNHPRSGTLGYFNMLQLDPETAAYALKDFDTSFDVLEIINGPYCHPDNASSIQDWLHLLDRGYYYPLVGSSDSHGIDRREPGYSRTYVYYKGEKGSNLDENALIQAIKWGHSFASNGPIINVKVNETFKCGDTLTDKDGKVDLKLRVQSASWVTMDAVRLIINGKRKLGFPIQQKNPGALDFTKNIQLNIKDDSYIVVEILGKKSLYPVMQATARNGLSSNAILPYALTNPIFIDVDGNGKFDPPIKGKIRLVNQIPETDNKEK